VAFSLEKLGGEVYPELASGSPRGGANKACASLMCRLL